MSLREDRRAARELARETGQRPRQVRKDLRFIKSEFERRLEEDLAIEAASGKKSKSTRCAKCGNMWRFCTCGGKVPWDCKHCLDGKGKGDPVGRDARHNTTVRGDRLCPKHQLLAETVGAPPRNRAEARRYRVRSRTDVTRRPSRRAHNRGSARVKGRTA